MSNLKPGDLVRCVRQEFNNETVGKIYKVLEIVNSDLDLRLVADDFGERNSYRSENFQLIGWRGFVRRFEESKAALRGSEGAENDG